MAYYVFKWILYECFIMFTYLNKNSIYKSVFQLLSLRQFDSKLGIAKIVCDRKCNGWHFLLYSFCLTQYFNCKMKKRQKNTILTVFLPPQNLSLVHANKNPEKPLTKKWNPIVFIKCSNFTQMGQKFFFQIHKFFIIRARKFKISSAEPLDLTKLKKCWRGW